MVGVTLVRVAQTESSGIDDPVVEAEPESFKNKKVTPSCPRPIFKGLRLVALCYLQLLPSITPLTESPPNDQLLK